ncbi:MAG: amino acid permease [Muribaculaceae bacterium]|nr:amino acid permease [Muribaculaceae bacterium]
MATTSATTNKTPAKQGAKMGVFTLVIMNIVAVVSLRGLPAEAEYGVSSAFYYILAGIVFLAPVSLVAAEFAAMFPYQQGGMFRWVGEAYGEKLGFLGIWLQWVESTIWYPTVLTFGAVALAFIGMDHIYDSHLAANKWYTICVVLAIYWLATLISLRGMGWVGKVSKIGGLVGTIIPVTILVILAIIYMATGHESQMDWHGSFIPDFSNFNNIIFAVSIFLFYAGMEMSGVHVRDIKNPTKNYPKAIIIGTFATVAIFILGTYALGVILPVKDINLVQSLLQGFDRYFSALHFKWFSPIIAIALAGGVLAEVLTWVAGPSKGVFAVGQAGYLPKFFQKSNKYGVQSHMLYIQGLFTTVLAFVMVLMPSVQSFYQILSQLTCILYLIVYLLMFASILRLRYTMPDAKRPFRIGKKGNWWLWCVAGAGFLSSAVAFVFSFFPPGQIAMGSNAVWFSVLIIGTIIFTVMPFIILHFKKASWLTPGNAFVPFHWNKSPQAQAELAAAAAAFEAEQAEEAADEQSKKSLLHLKKVVASPTPATTPASSAGDSSSTSPVQEATEAATSTSEATPTSEPTTQQSTSDQSANKN